MMFYLVVILFFTLNNTEIFSNPVAAFVNPNLTDRRLDDHLSPKEIGKRSVFGGMLDLLSLFGDYYDDDADDDDDDADDDDSSSEEDTVKEDETEVKEHALCRNCNVTFNIVNKVPLPPNKLQPSNVSFPQSIQQIMQQQEESLAKQKKPIEDTPKIKDDEATNDYKIWEKNESSADKTNAETTGVEQPSSTNTGKKESESAGIEKEESKGADAEEEKSEPAETTKSDAEEEKSEPVETAKADVEEETSEPAETAKADVEEEKSDLAETAKADAEEEKSEPAETAEADAEEEKSEPAEITNAEEEMSK